MIARTIPAYYARQQRRRMHSEFGRQIVPWRWLRKLLPKVGYWTAILIASAIGVAVVWAVFIVIP